MCSIDFLEKMFTASNKPRSSTDYRMAKTTTNKPRTSSIISKSTAPNSSHSRYTAAKMKVRASNLDSYKSPIEQGIDTGAGYIFKTQDFLVEGSTLGAIRNNY